MSPWKRETPARETEALTAARENRANMRRLENILRLFDGTEAQVKAITGKEPIGDDGAD